MKVRVQVAIETEAGESADVQEILEIERTELRPDTVGLTLDEAKTVLERIQQRIVEQQTAEYLRTQRHCPQCGNKRSHKGAHTVTLRTLFGKLRLKSLRLYHCQCRPHGIVKLGQLSANLRAWKHNPWTIVATAFRLRLFPTPCGSIIVSASACAMSKKYSLSAG